MDIGSLLTEMLGNHVHEIHLNIEQGVAQTKTPYRTGRCGSMSGHPEIVADADGARG
jgi:hypothetical protein